MIKVGSWLKSGSPWIWMTSGAVSLSLIAVLGLLLLIAWRGLSYFWPAPIYEWKIQDQYGVNSTLIGQIYDQEQVPVERLINSGYQFADPKREFVTRYLIKTGNRDIVGLDFRWILETEIISQKQPHDLALIERSKSGNFYGYPVAIIEDGKKVNLDDLNHIQPFIDSAMMFNKQAQKLQKQRIGAINYQLEQIRLDIRRHEINNTLTKDKEIAFNQIIETLNSDYQVLEAALFSIRRDSARDKLIVKDMRHNNVTINFSRIISVVFPNNMSAFDKFIHWCKNVINFVTDDPREANTEGGVFPAIFGTVFMVLLMAIIVTPFGVIAAIYLHEYAKKGFITKIIRIAVINLAGVPSIVYGVFGLGFFVYMLGGSLDQLFYPEALPSPTFGSPGVIWSALTLAILTLPVVIVSTEEGLSRIPSAVRQGSLALGATKAETLWRIVIPMASPAIMTGLILAVARAAGEVAPLMLVGVVKLAPTLPIDMNFPYIHLERKFMHLGFHIYDVGFQSPNVEAARPLVYATSFLLVTVIISLNLTAISVRNHLREKFRSLEH